MQNDDTLTYVRSRFDHAAAQRVLKEKYQGKLVFGWAGGMFRAQPDMIVLLSLYGDKDIVVPDLYDTPIKVNAADLLQEMQTRWQEQMTAWLIEHERLSQNK